ncbi:MAG: HAMP domain-containing protein, partial [Oscillospiraceae bacterium]|nr:HAMP domain-containing protein [Oscillospiraceae bacterium]
MAITANRERPLFWGRYQQKIAISYLIVIIAMLALMNTYPILISQQFVFQSKQTGMRTRALLIASTLAASESLNAEHVTEIINLLGEQGQLVVLDENGAGVYDSTDGGASFDELEETLAGYSVFHSAFVEREFRSVASAPIAAGGRVIGAVMLYDRDSERAQLLLGFQENMANMSVAITLLVVVISLIISSALTKRVSELLRAIKLAREGSFNHLVPVRGRDELAELADAFNSLTRRIQETDGLRRQFVSDASHELKTPLASMRLLADSVILTEDMPLPDVREFVGDIGDEIDRLTRMTEKLMLLTKLDSKISPVRQRVELAPLILRARHMLMPLANAKAVTIRCELEESCCILADEDDIYQVM